MNNTIVKLADAAWSKIEALSRLRKFIQDELDHSALYESGFSPENFYRALSRIDSFTAEFSTFLSLKNSQLHPEDLEDQFEELSARFSNLMAELEITIRH